MMREIWEKEKEDKVCAVDLDGVLVDYPKCWIDFVNKETQNEFETLDQMKMILSYKYYKDLKAQYRRSGIKAKLPAKESACKFVKKLQENNYKVILLTSRPYRLYREIWKDTMAWLKTNKITPDGIIWESEKHWAVLKEFPYLKFLVEDNAEIANQVAKLGYKVYVMDNEYNQQELAVNCFRVNELEQILFQERIK